MFHTLRQNNSGGFFTEPAVIVVVRADSEEEAYAIAERNGVYFDGCSTGKDCECCGDRWYRYTDETETLPELKELDFYWAKQDNIPVRVIIDNDNKITTEV